MLSREERETIIRFDELGKNANVYTYNSKLQKRLRELQAENIQGVVCRLINKDSESRSETWEIPKEWIKINPKRSRAPMSDEQREQVKERLAVARKQRKKGAK